MRDIIFTQDEYEACASELITFRNANRDTIRNRSYFDWRYKERPSKLKPVIIWAETGSGEKIGCLSLIPHHYFIDNASKYVGVLGDISVAEGWRGKGIAQQMFKYLAQMEATKKLCTSIALPNEVAARALMKAHWKTISTMERYVKIINTERQLKSLMGVFRALSKPVSLITDFVLKSLSRETYAFRAPGYKGEVISEFDDRFDILWDSANKEDMQLSLRNKNYLIWRYSNHPLTIYQVFTLTDNETLCGYIVFHMQKATCYIDDIFYLSRKYPSKLLIYFLKHIRNTTVCRISMTMSNNTFLDIKLWKFGFIKRFSNWRAMAFITDMKDNSVLLDKHKWYFTAGDKDA